VGTRGPGGDALERRRRDLCVLLAQLADDLRGLGPVQPAPVEEQGRQLRPEVHLRRQGQPEPLAEPDDMVLAGVHDLGPGVDVLPLGEAVPERQHPPTDPVSGFEHDDVVPGLLQTQAGHEPRQTGPDDDRLHGTAAYLPALRPRG
jgi:hypothetical protein